MSIMTIKELTNSQFFGIICPIRGGNVGKNLSITKKQFIFLIENMFFNEKKREKKIFDMWYKGYNNVEIANVLNLSSKTIYRRKKELLKRINFFLNENQDLKETYIVYIHIFPNKKVYIGMTNNVEERWKNGLGYIANEKMFNDILLYGWNNIEHNIIEDNLSYKEAMKLENEKINEYKSYIEEYGYNIRVEQKGEFDEKN